jgi:hypothetical protein
MFGICSHMTEQSGGDPTMTAQPRKPILAANLAEQLLSPTPAPAPISVTVQAPPGATVTVVVTAPEPLKP